MPQSRVQISGLRRATWASRSVAPTMSVLAASTGRTFSSPPRTKSPPIPAVRLITTSVPDDLIRSTTSAYKSTSREPLPVFGSLTWICTTAAPAFAASIADSAICCGVTGTLSLLPVVSPAPVTAQVMKTSQFMMKLYLEYERIETGYLRWAQTSRSLDTVSLQDPSQFLVPRRNRHPKSMLVCIQVLEVRRQSRDL